jgi:IclR family KDG regulon transcriptional repressor
MEIPREKTTSLASLERMFDVIEYLDVAPKEASIQEISSETDINKSTVFRILNTLCLRGYVFQNPETKKYALSLAFYHVGLRAKNKMSDAQRLSPLIPDLENLRNKYQENVSVATLDLVYKKRMKVVNLLNLKSTYMLERPERDISSLEAYTTAAGKCLLAFSPESYLEHFKNAPLERVTPYSISDWNSLVKELAEIREKGFAECNNEHEIGISCIAVPVFSVNGGEIKAALSISGDTERIFSERSDAMIADLHAMAAKMASAF